MSDHEIITWLMQQVNDLKAENASLQEIIFRSQGLLDTEVKITPSPADGSQNIGKEPWYRAKMRLERLYSRKKSTEDIQEEELHKLEQDKENAN